MAEQKDVRSPPLMKTPKSQLMVEQPLIKNCWNLQKRYATFKEKEATMTWQKGYNCDKIKSHTCIMGDPQTGKQLYDRSYPRGVKVLIPTSGTPS